MCRLDTLRSARTRCPSSVGTRCSGTPWSAGETPRYGIVLDRSDSPLQPSGAVLPFSAPTPRNASTRGPQPPGRAHQSEEDERLDDLTRTVAGERVRRRRPGQVEEEAGIRPFLQQRKPRHGDGDGAEDLPGPEDVEQVWGVAEVGELGHRLLRTREEEDSADHEALRAEEGGYPVGDESRPRRIRGLHLDGPPS